MDSQQVLFSELITKYSLIDERITDISNSMVGDDGGNITLNYLLNEALTTLIAMLVDQGIYFHVDDEELLGDYYNARHLITLYDLFTPGPLNDRLHHDPVFFKNISAAIDGLGESEYIVHILAAYRDVEMSDNAKDLYTFLHDKVYNDALYAHEVQMLTEALVDQADEPAAVINDSVRIHLKSIATEREWYYRVINHQEVIELGLDLSTSTVLGRRFRLEFVESEHLNFAAQFVADSKCNPELAQKFVKTLRQVSSYYVDSYSDEQLAALGLDDVIAIILTQLSDQHLFCVVPDYRRLREVSPHNIEFLVKQLTEISQRVRIK